MIISEHDCMHTDCEICNPPYYPTNRKEIARLDARRTLPSSMPQPVCDMVDDCLSYLAYDDDTWLKSEYNHDGDWIGWKE